MKSRTTPRKRERAIPKTMSGNTFMSAVLSMSKVLASLPVVLERMTQGSLKAEDMILERINDAYGEGTAMKYKGITVLSWADPEVSVQASLAGDPAWVFKWVAHPNQLADHISKEGGNVQGH